MFQLSKKAAIWLAAILLFVSLSLALHLITECIAEAEVLPQISAETPTELEQKAEPDVSEHQEPNEPETEAEQPVTEHPVTEEKPQDVPALDIDTVAGVSNVTVTEDSLVTVVSGLLQSFTDYGLRYTVSDRVGNVQSVNYLQGGSLYTDIVVQTADGTLHCTVNRTADTEDRAYAALVATLTERYGVKVPVAAEVEMPQAPIQQITEGSEHDEPVIVR